MRARFLTSLTLSALLFAGIASFADPDEEQFKALYREGLDLYNRGQKKEAYEKLEQALRIKVDDKLVLYMRDEMSWKTLQMMMMDEGEIRQTALRIMELAKSKAANLKKNEAEIEAYVLQLDSPKFVQVTEAEMHLRAVGSAP
jgi:tetratricopeptide (TPR) repeat protein